MCPSLAEPVSGGIPRTSRRQIKSFSVQQFFKNAAEVWASSPDRCPQAAKSPCHPSGTRRGWLEKRQLFEAGRTRPPRLVSLKQSTDILQLFRGNSCNGNTLQKILLLGKTVFRIRQKGVPPLLLPASVLQLPHCLVRICNLFHKDNQIANWQVSKNAIAAGKTDCETNLLRKCGLLAHTSPTFLKNCWIKKLLFRLRLVLGKPTAYGSAKSLCSLPWCCSPVVALSELSMNLS